MKRFCLVALLVGAHATTSAQSRDYRNWHYRGDSVPDFPAASDRCSALTGGAESGSSTPDLSAKWSACIAEAQWVSVRRHDVGSLCEPLSLTVVGDLPAGLTRAGADTLLTMVRQRILDHWVPSATRSWLDWQGEVMILVSSSAESISIKPLQAISGAIDEMPLNLVVRRRASGGSAQPEPFPAVAKYSYFCVGIRERPAANVSEVFHWHETDHQAEPDPRNPKPPYPHSVPSGTPGQVTVTFVVDTAGRVEPGTMRVERSTLPEFAEAVRLVLPKLRYLPGEIEGKKVRQLVLTGFNFR